MTSAPGAFPGNENISVLRALSPSPVAFREGIVYAGLDNGSVSNIRLKSSSLVCIWASLGHDNVSIKDQPNSIFVYIYTLLSDATQYSYFCHLTLTSQAMLYSRIFRNRLNDSFMFCKYLNDVNRANCIRVFSFHLNIFKWCKTGKLHPCIFNRFEYIVFKSYAIYVRI